LETHPGYELSQDSDRTTLVVKYDGVLLKSGVMELDDLLPALAGIRSAMLLASQDINRGDVQARVLISANIRGASFEFTLFFFQMLSTVSNLLTMDNIRSAADIVNSIFGENGLVSSIKQLKASPKQPVTKTELPDGSVRIEVHGNNNVVQNTIIVTPEVATLYGDQSVRESVLNAIMPLAKNGIETVSFSPPASGTNVSSSDVDSFLVDRPEQLEPLDSFGTTDEVVTVIKPSFDNRRRWKLQLGDLVFGAKMEDHHFQSSVMRREVLFGTGDRLKIRLARRTHKAKETEYFVVHVYDFLRPPQQMTFRLPEKQ
jgi:hypothetical protein